MLYKSLGIVAVCTPLLNQHTEDIMDSHNFCCAVVVVCALAFPAVSFAVTPRTRRDEKDISIFDDLKGRASATPRTLLRNMSSKLQALATTPGPVPLAR